VIQASSAAVSGVAVGAGVLAAVLRAGAGAGAARWPAHPPTASKTAAPSPATAGLPPPRLMIAKNRPDEYGDGSIVPPTSSCPRKDAPGKKLVTALVTVSLTKHYRKLPRETPLRRASGTPHDRLARAATSDALPRQIARAPTRLLAWVRRGIGSIAAQSGPFCA